MNENYHNGEIDSALLDRMVDGELGESDQQKFLSQLDEAPENWRRLALAYVEAQTWGRELRSFPAEQLPVPAQAVSVTSSRKSSSMRGTISMVAGLIIAFGMGILLRSFIFQDESDLPEPGSQIVNSEPQSDHTVMKPEDPRTFSLLVADPATNSAEEVELPLVDFNEVGETFFQSNPQAMPSHVRRAFERAGHRVEEKRHFYPFELQDGRRVIVPVDEVQVQYVGGQTYQ